jgi:hypothetical protein
VALVAADIPEECFGSTVLVKIIRELGTLMMEAIHSSEMSVRTRVTWLHIPEDGILHGHCREHLQSYIALTGWIL